MADDLLASVLAWARKRDDIRALIQTASRVRLGGPVDACSDFDIEVFTTRPGAYDSCDWPAAIGKVWVCLPLAREDDARYRMRLVVFQGGTKVDFAIAPAQLLAETVERGSLPPLWDRGYSVLLDRDGLAGRLPPPSGRPPVPTVPSEAEFRAVVDEFWFEASQIPTYVARGELWVVKFRDWPMKSLLLRMLEWRAAVDGRAADVWQIGAHLRDWLPPELVARSADLRALRGERQSAGAGGHDGTVP